MGLANIVDGVGNAASLIALVGGPVIDKKVLNGNGSLGLMAGMAAYYFIFEGKERLSNYIKSRENYIQ